MSDENKTGEVLSAGFDPGSPGPSSYPKPDIPEPLEGYNLYESADGIPNINHRQIDAAIRPLHFRHIDPLKEEVFQTLNYPIPSRDHVLYTISSELHFLALASARAYIEKYFSTYHLFQLELTPQNSSEAVATLECLLQHLKVQSTKRPKLTLIEITDSVSFWKSFCRSQLSQLDRILSLHQDIASNLLVAGQLHKIRPPELTPLYWEVPAMPVLIEQLLPREEALSWVQKIKATPGAHERFTDTAPTSWLPNGRKLRAHLEVVCSREISPLTASINQKQPQIDIWIQFLAASLDDLEFSFFRQLIDCLITGETAKETIEESGDNESGDNESNQNPKRPNRRTITVSLRDKWQQEADEILQRCNLTFTESVAGQVQLDFTVATDRPSLRSSLKSRFPFQIHRLLQKILAAGVLFSADASLESFRQLLVLTFDAEPQAEGWWRQLAAGYKAPNTSPESIDESTSEQTLLSLLADETASTFRDRLPTLIGELARRGDQRRMEFFWRVFIPGLRRTSTLSILDDLIIQLRFTSGFDDLGILKRILNEGPTTAKMRSAQLLLYLLITSREPPLSRLEQIYSWIPHPDAELAEYSDAEKFALEFLLVIAFREALVFPDDEQGMRPNRYLLFADANCGGHDWQRQQKLILDWLQHPRLPELRRREEKSADEKRILHVGTMMFLLERWAQIIEGLDAQNEGSQGEIIDGMLRSLLLRWSLKEKRTAERWMLDRIEIYALEIDSTERQLGHPARALRAKRLKLERLVRRLRTAIQRPNT